MEKRSYKKTGEAVSLLGFGMMRLPVLEAGKPDINYDLGQKMVDYAVAHGVNYFDTAYPYHEGKSEPFTGHALSKYKRDSFFLASKMPTWELKDRDSAPRLLSTQLNRLRMDYIDFYLCHALGSFEDYTAKYEKLGAINYLEEQKKKGIIRKLGFSFHGEVSDLEKLTERREWDFVQIQANYLDWDAQNAKRLYEITEEKNIPCIIMEPVRGGMLATLNEESLAILKAAEPGQSAASWALRFAASLPNVFTVLSGMSTMEQVEDNVKTLEGFKALTEGDYRTLQKALAVFLNTGSVPCTGCRYCMDCPSGVDIPGVFAVYNKCAAAHQIPVSFGDSETVRKSAAYFAAAYREIPEKSRAHNCVTCNICMEHCPQGIKIPDQMKSITRMARGLTA
ncbi:MAG: aldo/keto reductase [Spirochaetaceae bacterium]|jgi:predicted aldo/keto reductase-like oxidoreductase|nr:aldo/keto reductase [Spirochaetaceae bacterium]